MRVVETKDIEDCFDGSCIKEVRLEAPITKSLVFALGNEGDVRYYDHFARPFFKVRVPNKFDLKGIAGNDTLRVHLKNPEEYSLERFCALLAAQTTGDA